MTIIGNIKMKTHTKMLVSMSKHEPKVRYLRCSTKLSIVSDPPQGPRSKTSMAQSHSRMDKMKMMNPEYVASISDRSMIDGVHVINIFVTDKSLAQTEQIRHRYETSGARFNENIIDYSSKAKSGITDIDKLLSRLLTRPKKDTDLIDSVICCAHSKRFEDIVEVIESINRNQYNLFESCGIHTVHIRLIFDECDVKQNVTNLNKMLKSFRIKGISIGDSSVIRDIVFVSATPDRNFWKMLEKYGITALYDIKHMLEQDGLLVKMTTEEYTESYTSYQSHLKTYCDFDDPCEMLKSLWPSMLDKWRNVLGKNTGMHVFCPGTRFNESQDEIRDYCKNHGHACLVHNGVHKCIFMPDGKNISCPGGEMRDFLADWNTEYPKIHLVITGNLTIRRGLTFVTRRSDGSQFQFSFGLFANSVFESLEEAVQLVSRMSGHADYADTCTIYISEKQGKAISKWFDRKLACVDAKLKITMEDCVALTPKEIERKNMNIPLVFAIERKEMTEIIKNKKGNRYDTVIIKSIIDKYDSENVWSNIMTTHKKKQITLPQSVKSINKMIVDLEYSINSNAKWCKDFSKKDKEQSCYSIILEPGWNQSKRDVSKPKQPYYEAVPDETQQPKMYLMYYTKRDTESSQGATGPSIDSEGGAAGGGGADPTPS